MPPHRKEPPDRTLPHAVWLDLVTHPEKNASRYVNLESAADAAYRFRPDATSFSRANAWWLAEAALLAYWSDDAQAQEIYRRQTGLACVPLSEGGTQCHLVVAPDFAIVAFRGTQPGEWQDILDDGRFGLTPWTHGHVHKGFDAAYQRMAAALSAAIGAHAPGRPLWITGHSLGAAVATLAADALPNVAGIYTFGSPLVGDQRFAGGFNRRFANRSFRYVNDHDIVTHLPPELLGLPVGVYTHVTASRAIDKNGNVGTAPATLPHLVSDVFGRPVAVWELMRALLDGRIASMPDAFADHAPVLYATHAWNSVFANGD